MVHSMNAEDANTVEEPAEKNKLDLDTFWAAEIGIFGRYQAKFFAICAVYIIVASMSGSEYIFTTAKINTRCLVPECDVESPEFSPSWALNAIPGSGSTFEDCERYVPLNNSYDPTCPADAFDQTETQACDDYVYENTLTVVYDLGLACDEWRRSLLGSIKVCGYLASLGVTGFLSDRWGRKLAFVINAVNMAWIGSLRYFAKTYLGFAISEFMESLLGSGGFTCAYILVMEILPPKYRVVGGAFINCLFSTGQMLLALVAWAVPDWRKMTLAIYLPQLLAITLFWTVDESVRWLMSKGRYEESEKILKYVAKVNKREISQESLRMLRMSNEEERKKQEHATVAGKSPSLLKLLLQHKSILLRTTVTPIWWITSIFVYYGLSINAVNLSGNKYVNYIAVSAVDIPGFFTAVYLLGKIGRKPVLIGAYWTCCACMVGYIFVSSSSYAVSLSLYLISKFAIATVITSIYVYTAELYPTPYRHTLFAFSSMMGRLGSITAPLTPALGEALFPEFPFIMYASLCLLSSLLIFVTPETLGTKLPDTMEEATHPKRSK